MFGGMRQRWAEARGDVILAEVSDNLARAERLERPLATTMHGAFVRMDEGLQHQLGHRVLWTPVTRKTIIKKLGSDARAAFKAAPSTRIVDMMARAEAMGAALLASLYEAEDTPGPNAAEAKRLIEGWDARRLAERERDGGRDR